jgi:hypothetical protein
VEVIFAVVVTVLAAVAVVGALVFAIVWEVCAIKRTLAEHRRRVGQPGAYWRDRAALSTPERRS